MTTQHPAGDGDTRPTDRERLILQLTGALHLHGPSRDDRCHACPGYPAAGPRHYAEVAVNFLAARAPAPPDAAQAWPCTGYAAPLTCITAALCDPDGDHPAECDWCRHHAHQPERSEYAEYVEYGPSCSCGYNGPYAECAAWRVPQADRLAAEPDAATRTVQVEVYVREPGPEVTEVEDQRGLTWRRDGGRWKSVSMNGSARWYFDTLANAASPIVPVGTRARLRAAADPGTRGEGDDRG